MSAGLVIVRSSVAPLTREARVDSGQVSQVLAGHALRVLEERDEWLRVRGIDGYDGWIHRGYVYPPGAVGPNEDLPVDYVPRVSLGCTVRNSDGRARALPLGAWLDENEQVESGESVPLDELATRFPKDPGAIARSGMKWFEGTHYEWGGVTPWGADCSGFVQTIFSLHGVQLPRDSMQQAREGLPLPNDFTALRAADLLFFSDQPDDRITHVAMSTGSLGIVHIALGRGGYAVERLDSVIDPYVEKLRQRFRGARRILK